MDRHPRALFLKLVEIEHRITRVAQPQSNGRVEQFPPHAPRRTPSHQIKDGDESRVPGSPQPESRSRPQRREHLGEAGVN